MINWGLQIGNMVKCDGMNHTLRGVRLDDKDNEIWLELSDGLLHPDYDCKPIVRPLSDMTKIEKEEMQRRFFNEYGVVDRVFIDSEGIVMLETTLPNKKIIPLNTREVIFLIKKGFDCGQFYNPNDYILENLLTI